jgi:hypothetical protein
VGGGGVPKVRRFRGECVCSWTAVWTGVVSRLPLVDLSIRAPLLSTVITAGLTARKYGE